MTDGQAHAALKQSRMLMSLIRDPKGRIALVDALGGGEVEPRLGGLDWLSPEGIDAERVGDHHTELSMLASERGILAYGPISQWPARDGDKPAFVAAVMARVFAGVSRGWLTEAELTARVGMLFFDEAGLRRYAVDAGLVERAEDGSRYWLA
ncbi:DUF2087 domain-containing protein [Demequina globuliformis]|uniref:DUF2087 domain-containing protein n=1 Tax=Demequina globuliformis TaxID=676202 RepID=UPI0007840045|nr:DUF2087 domain-containing protein [Demequina globuliformis]